MFCVFFSLFSGEFPSPYFIEKIMRPHCFITGKQWIFISYVCSDHRKQYNYSPIMKSSVKNMPLVWLLKHFLANFYRKLLKKAISGKVFAFHCDLFIVFCFTMLRVNFHWVTDIYDRCPFFFKWNYFNKINYIVNYARWSIDTNRTNCS